MRIVEKRSKLQSRAAALEGKNEKFGGEFVHNAMVKDQRQDPGLERLLHRPVTHHHSGESNNKIQTRRGQTELYK